MIFLIAVLSLLTGIVINALADSLPISRRLEGVRCQDCGAPRPASSWSGLVGTLSGLRCPYCGRPRTRRAAIVEASMLAIGMLLYLADPSPADFLPAFLVASIFLLITVIDVEHRLILHVVSGPAALVIGILSILDPSRGAAKTLYGGAAGFGIVLGFFLLGGLLAQLVARVRGEELEEVAFGFGDVALAGVIGLAVGWPGVLLAILIGVFAAGIFSLLFMLAMTLMGRYRPFLAIPYGPFLVFGAAVVYYGGRDLLLGLLAG